MKFCFLGGELGRFKKNVIFISTEIKITIFSLEKKGPTY
jgi:hypothetical protein